MLGPPTVLGWGIEHAIGTDPWLVATWSRVERAPTTALFGTQSGFIVTALLRDDLSSDSAAAEVEAGVKARTRTIPAAGRALARALAMAGVDPRKTGIALCLALPPREERRDRDDEVLDNAAWVDALAAAANVQLDPDASRVFEGGPAAGVAAFIAGRDRLAIDALESGPRVVVVGGARPLVGTRHVDRLANARLHEAGGGAFGSVPAEAAAFVVLGRQPTPGGRSAAMITGLELLTAVPEQPPDEPQRTDEESAALALEMLGARLGMTDETWILAAMGGAPMHGRIFSGARALASPRHRTEAESNLGDAAAATAPLYVALACEMARRGCAPSGDVLVALPSLLPVGALRLEVEVAPPPEREARTDAFGAAAVRAARNALRDVARRIAEEGSDDRIRLIARGEMSLAAFESGLRRDDEILGLLDEATRELRGVRAELDAEPEPDLDEDDEDEAAARRGRERMRATCSDALDALVPVRAGLVEYLATPRTPPPERASPRLHAADGVVPLDPFVLPPRIGAVAPVPGAARKLVGTAGILESAAHNFYYAVDRHRSMRQPGDGGDGDAELTADARCAAALDAIFALREHEAARRGGLDLIDVLEAFSPPDSPLPHRTYVRALVLGCTAGIEAARHAAETLIATRGGARAAAAAALVLGTSPDLDRAIESLLERRDADLAATALDILHDRRSVRVGRVAPHLLRSEPMVRRAAARALGVSPSKDAAALALGVTATTDVDEDVRDVALVALARHGDPAAMERARFQCAERPRHRLLEVLALGGAPEDAGVLMAQTSDEALDLLGWYGAIGATGHLCDVLDAERTDENAPPTERARAASRALIRITGAVWSGSDLSIPADPRPTVPSLLETRPEPWRRLLASAELPRAPRLRFGRIFERRAASREIALGGRARDRDRAELEAAIGFRCGGAIPSPRGWLSRVRDRLVAMGALSPLL